MLWLISCRLVVLLYMLSGYVTHSPKSRIRSPPPFAPADFRMHIYDMTHPPIPYKRSRAQTRDRNRHGFVDDETTMKETKTVVGHEGWWTITDSHLSPDNERCVSLSLFYSDDED